MQPLDPLRFMLIVLAGWISQQQLELPSLKTRNSLFYQKLLALWGAEVGAALPAFARLNRGDHRGGTISDEFLEHSAA